jgi:hypothetical protein
MQHRIYHAYDFLLTDPNLSNGTYDKYAYIPPPAPRRTIKIRHRTRRRWPLISLHGSTPSISLRRSCHEERCRHDRRAPSSSTRTAALHRQSSEPGHGYGFRRRRVELVADNDDDHDDSNHHPHGKNLTHTSARGSKVVIIIGLVKKTRPID